MDPEPRRTTENPSSQRDSSTPTIVGLGASAGGLEALQHFFAEIPADCGISFVIIEHLSPQRPSLLADLLGRQAAVRVVQATTDTLVEINHAYVIAPGTFLTLEGDHLSVHPASRPQDRNPIDRFFGSLAEGRGAGAIGIVLSGAGNDGTEGLRAIKDQGGVTLVQAPETAKFDSMPRSAIEAGIADVVLPPPMLAKKLLEDVREGRCAATSAGASTADAVKLRLPEICAALQEHSDQDFSEYKEGTLLRRILRRMQFMHLADAETYVGLLRQDRSEAERLVGDLLIGVTRFFRDPDAFDALAETVIPALVDSAPPESGIRVWVPGCASGEEAYSIAILIREQLERAGTDCAVKVFATDLDSGMLSEARIGRYPLGIADQVSPARLARFFVLKGDHYEVADVLRECCVFTQHNLISDPPFSRLDLISCRNLLIYFSAEVQAKLAPIFHYALRPDGTLFLGSSEGINASSGLFETLDKANRIFRRREVVGRPVATFSLNTRAAQRQRTGSGQERPTLTSPQRFTEAFERLVLAQYVAPCAVVNERGDILRVAGRMDRYIRLPTGSMTNNLIDLVTDSLRTELRAALQSVASGQRPAVRMRIPVELDDGVYSVRLGVRPLPEFGSDSGLFIVALEDGLFPDESPSTEDRAELSARSGLERLEAEYRATRQELQTTLDDFEAANEELQSANEELQASQEELQSLNEELETVNAELNQKLVELSAANNDLQNLFVSTDIATLFLDLSCRIVKFTPAATTLFRLLPTDIGRPIEDLASPFDDLNLGPLVHEVVDSLTPVECHVRTSDGQRWFVLRILPYRTLDNRIEGAVLTLVDISSLKKAQDDLRLTTERERFLAETIENATTPFGSGTPDGKLLLFNRAFAELTGYSREELEDPEMDWARDLTPPEWRELEADALGRAVLEKRSARYEKEYLRKDGVRVPIELTVQPVFGKDGELQHYRSFLQDITERKRIQAELDAHRRHLEQLIDERTQELREARDAAEAANRAKSAFLANMSHEIRTPMNAILGLGHLLRQGDLPVQKREQLDKIEVAGRHLLDIINSILDLSKIESGKITLEESEVRVDAIVRNLVAMLSDRVEAKQLALRVQLQPLPLNLRGDPVRIQQALLNYATNAIKFTESGSITLRGRLEADLGDSALIHFEVEDTGIGIAPEHLPRLFSAFEQADHSITRKYGGTGLGLALTKRLAQLMGGDAGAHSTLGAGSTFWFTVRLARGGADAHSPGEPDQSQRGQPLEPHDVSGRRVLLVEDEPVNREVAFGLMMDLNLAVDSAENGAEALDLVRRNRYDLILMDMQMPVMDGLEATRQIRRLPQAAEIPIVAMTANAFAEDRAQCMEAGMTDFLPKPVEPEKLLAMLQRWLPRPGCDH